MDLEILRLSRNPSHAAPIVHSWQSVPLPTVLEPQLSTLMLRNSISQCFHVIHALIYGLEQW